MLLVDWLNYLRVRFDRSQDNRATIRRRKIQRRVQLYSESLEERLMLDGSVAYASLDVLMVDGAHYHSSGTPAYQDVSMFEGGTATATVSVTGPLTETVSVILNISSGDFSPAISDSITLTFGPSNTVQTYSYQTLDNSVDELTRTINFSISAGVGTAIGPTANSAFHLHVLDDDWDANLAFTSVVNLTVPESIGNLTDSQLQLSSHGVAPPFGGGIYYVSHEGTAKFPYDYSSLYGAINIPLQTPWDGSIPIVGDGLDEDDETFTADFFAVDEYGSNPYYATSVRYLITIVDDDAPPQVTLEPFSNVQINEGMSGQYAVKVPLSNKPITVVIATQGGTATSGTDYYPVTTTTINVPAWNYQGAPLEYVYFGTVNTIDDMTYEPNETFNVHIVSTTNATAGPDLQFTILDNDIAPLPPTFNQSTYYFSINELAMAGMPLGSVSATSMAGAYPLTYSGGNYPFTVDSTGNVTLTAAGVLDYETTPGHQKTFQATVTDTNGMTATATIVVQITDDYEPSPPEFTQSTYNFNVHETSTAGTIAGSVLATTGASPSTITYSGGTSPFTVNAAGQVVLSTANVLDYETTTNHTISFTVTATDFFGLTSSATVVIHLLDDNEKPTLDSIQDFNLEVGDLLMISPVGHDVDAGDTLTYTAGGQVGLQGHVEFYGEAMIGDNGVPLGSFRFIPGVNNAGHTYQESITVHDSAGLTETRYFTITVAAIIPGQINTAQTDYTINEDTDWSSADISVALAQQVRSSFGVLATDDAPSLGDWILTNHAPFYIGPGSTPDTFRLFYDHNELGGGSTWTIPLRYTTYVHGPIAELTHIDYDDFAVDVVSKPITIQIQEVNSTPNLVPITVTPDHPYEVTVLVGSELAVPLEAFDLDVPAQELGFRLENIPVGTPLGLDIVNVVNSPDSYGQGHATGTLFLPDGATTAPGTYSVLVVAYDNYGGTSSQLVTIHVVYPPPLPPEFPVNAYDFNIHELDPVGTAVGSLTAWMDPNAGPNSLTFSGSSGPFTVNADGSIILNAAGSAINYETITNHQISFTVTVTDQHGLTDTATVVIHILNDDEAPSLDFIPNLTLKVGDTRLILPASSDPDVGDIPTYSSGGVEFDRHTIYFGEGSNGDNGVPEGGFRYVPHIGDAGHTYMASITVTDEGGLTDTREFTITVLPVTPAQIDVSGTTFDINENDEWSLTLSAISAQGLFEPDQYWSTGNTLDPLAWQPLGAAAPFRLVATDDPNQVRIVFIPGEVNSTSDWQLPVSLITSVSHPGMIAPSTIDEIVDVAAVSITVHVHEINNPPTLSVSNLNYQDAVTIAAGTDLVLPLTSDDDDLPVQDLYYTLAAVTGGASINGMEIRNQQNSVDPDSGTRHTTAEFHWATAATQVPGDYSVIITCNDGSGGFTSKTLTIHVIAPSATLNRPPRFNSDPVVDAEIGSPYAYLLQAIDPDDDPLAFSIVSGPAGMTLTGTHSDLLTWMSPDPAKLNQAVPVTVRVTDNHGASNDQVFQILVHANSYNLAPVITSVPSTDLILPGDQIVPSGDVQPQRIYLEPGEIGPKTISINIGALPPSIVTYDQVDIFFLLDDTASVSGGLPSVSDRLVDIINQLGVQFEHINFAFGVGRFEDYGAGFMGAGDPLLDVQRPFILNQPIVSTDTPGFMDSIVAATHRSAPGAGGDGPESYIEGLYQVATGAGFDGDNNGTINGLPLDADEDSPDAQLAGMISTQVTPNGTGDVPSFASYPRDPNDALLDPAGTLGGVGFRTNALKLVLLATDAGMAFEPEETPTSSISSAYGAVPYTDFTANGDEDFSRGSTPQHRGARIQDTIDALNALDIHVIPLLVNKFNDNTTSVEDGVLNVPENPAQQLKAIARATGAINNGTTVLDNNFPAAAFPDVTINPGQQIALGDPLLFWVPYGQLIPENLIGDLVDQLQTAVKSAIVSSLITKSTTIRVKSIDPTLVVKPSNTKYDVPPYSTVSFDLEFNLSNAPKTFPLQIVNEKNGEELGVVPVSIGNHYYYVAEAFDPEGGTLTWHLDTPVPGAVFKTIAPGKAILQWMPEAVGVYQFELSVADDHGATTPQKFSVTVTAADIGPKPDLGELSDSTATWFKPWTRQVVATDPAGGPVRYFLDAPPAGMTIDWRTGILAWTPQTLEDPLPESDVIVKVIAYTVGGNHQDRSFVIHVGPPDPSLANYVPKITSLAPKTAVVGSPWTYHLTAQDFDSDPVQFTVVTPSNAKIDPTTQTLIWIPTEAQLGQTSVSIQVSDGHPFGSSTQTFNVTVSMPNRPPVFNLDPDTTGYSGEPGELFIDAFDPDLGDFCTLSVDLLSLSAGFQFDPDANLLTWASLEAGTYAVPITAVDSHGLATEFVLTVLISDPSTVTFTSAPTKFAAVGTAWTYVPEAQDEQGNSVAVVLSPNVVLPNWLSFGTNGITGTPPATGEVELVFYAVQNQRIVAQQKFTLTIALAINPGHHPAWTSVPTGPAFVGTEWRYYLSASDEDATDTLTYVMSPISTSAINASAALIHDSTGDYLSWTPAVSAAGQLADFEVTVSDQTGLGRSQRLALPVEAVPADVLAPQFDSTPVILTSAATSYLYQAHATPSEAGDTVTYSLLTHPAGMAISAAGNVTWIPDDVQYANVVIEALDSYGRKNWQSYTIQVLTDATNHDPVITTRTPPQAYLGIEWVYPLAATDADGDPVKFELIGAPDGMSLGADNKIRWTPTNQSAAQLTLLAHDGRGGVDGASLTIPVNINYAPYFVATPPAEPVAYIGTDYTFAFKALDQNDGPTIGDERVSVSLDPVSKSLGMKLQTSHPSSTGPDSIAGLLRWTPGAGTQGPHTVTLTATDSHGASTTHSFEILVRDSNPTEKIVNQTIAVGQNWKYLPITTDTGGAQLTLMFAEDNAAHPASMSIVTDPATESNFLAWTPVESELGQTVIHIVVSDGFGVIAQQAVTLHVLPQGIGTGSNTHAPAWTSSATGPAYLGYQWEYQLAATDLDSSTLTYSILSGPDGTSGMAIDPVTHKLTWVPTREGNYHFLLQVSDGELNGYQDVDLPVTHVNQAPELLSVPYDPIIGSEWTYQVVAVDPDHDFLKYMVQATQGSEDNVDPETGNVIGTDITGEFRFENNVLHYTPTVSAENHPIQLIITVDDGHGGIASDTVWLNATVPSATLQQPDPDTENPNQPAYIVSVPAHQAFLGQVWTYQLQAVDPDGNSAAIEFFPEGNFVPGMDIDNRTGLLTWDLTDTPAGSIPQAYTVKIRLRDERGGETIYSFPLHVSAINEAPEITSTPSGPAFVNRTWVYQVEATDPNGDPLYYSVDEASAAAGVTIDVNGLLMWTPTAGTTGRPIVVFVADRPGVVNDLSTLNASVQDGVDRPFWTQQAFVVPVSSVTPTSETLLITSLPPAAARTDLSFQYRVVAHDPYGGPVAYSLVNAPLGLSIDPSTGLLTRTTVFTQGEIGNYQVVVQVSSADGRTAQQAFRFSVVAPYKLNEAPEIVVPGQVTVSRDLPFQYQVVAIDPNPEDVLTYQLQGAPSGFQIDSHGVLSGTFRFSGTYKLTVIVSDGTFSDTETINFTIEANAAPQLAAIPDQLVAVNSSLTIPLNATDPNMGDQLVYGLTEHPAGMDLINVSGTWQLTWTATSADKGRHPVTVVVKDQHGASVSRSFDVQVIQQGVNETPVIDGAPRTNIPIGLQFKYQVQAHDSDGDLLTYMLESRPLGMEMDPQGLITWRPTVSQINPAGYDITVKVTDARGQFSTKSWHVRVTGTLINSAPIISSSPKYSATVGYEYVYQPVATDADGDQLVWKLDAGSPAGMEIDSVTGRLTWTPLVTQTGPKTVTIRVSDGYGGVAAQVLALSVLGANLPPQIDSDPPVMVELGTTYQYQVVAHDPDEGTLTYSLLNPPTDMSISPEGLITWIANSTGIKNITVHITDDHGGSNDQIYQLQVYDPAVNRPPVFDSTPPTYVLIGETFSYQPHASDAQQVLYGLGNTAVALGLKMDALTGLITWTPTSAGTGTHLITITATDITGDPALSLTVVQTFLLTVRTNAAPTLTNVPNQTLTAGLPFNYALQAADTDLDVLTYTVSASPAVDGWTVDSQGLLHWDTGLENAGQTYAITVVVTDGFGGSVTKTFNMAVIADTQQPNVAIQSQPQQLVLGGTGQIHVEASDDVGIDSLILTVMAVPTDDPTHFIGEQFVIVNGGVLAGHGNVSFIGTMVGTYAFSAVALDAQGNSRTVSSTLTVIPDTFAPKISLTNPYEGQVITEPLDILGTIDDADSNSGTTYTLSYQTAGGPLVQFASGSGEVHGGLLGHFDPTVLSNGTYTITVTATDALGNSQSVVRHVQVTGHLKLGNFTLGATDMQINTVGIPLTVGRTYDSLNADKDLDFGYGWKLNFSIPQAAVIYSQNEPSSTGDYTKFTDGTRIVVTLPDGTTAGFTFSPYQVISNGLGAPWGVTLYKPYFIPDPGVESQLWVENFENIYLAKPAGSDEYLPCDANGNGNGEGYNPIATNSGSHTNLMLVDHTGSSVTFDPGHVAGQPTAAWIQDRQGNRVTYADVSPTETTVTYSRVISQTADHNDPNNRDLSASATRQIVIVRDEQTHHVTSIYNRDDASHPITFHYDGNELAEVIGRGQTAGTVYGYDEVPPGTDPLNLHYLTSVTDPQGRKTSTIHYADNPNTPQADYRVSTTEDNAGVQSTYSYTLANGSYTQSIQVVDSTPAGSPEDDGNDTSSQTSFTLDKRGNPILQTSAAGLTVARQYDSDGHLLKEIQVIGEPDSPSNGEHDDITQKSSYDRWGAPIASTDASGQTNRLSYDQYGNVIGSTDPLGNTTQFVYASTQGYIEGHEYTELGLIQSATTNGQTTNFTYDAQGNLTTVRDASHPDVALVENHYNGLGQLEWTRSATGQFVAYEYDAYGMQITTKRWLQPVTDPDDLPTDGMVIDHTEYDDAGRVQVTWQEQLAIGASVSEVLRRTETAYNVAGQVTSTSSYAGNLITSGNHTDVILISSSETIYDRRGMVIESRSKSNAINARWSVTRTVYDDLGRIIFSSEPYLESADADSEPSELVMRGTRTFYDALGHVIATESRIDVTVTIDNFGDDLSRTASIADDDWGTLLSSNSSTFDEQGREVSSQDQYGFHSQTIYDARGNVTESRTEAQTAAGDLVWLVSRTVYNDHGQVVISTHQFRSDATTTNGTRNVYDAQGRVIRTERLSGIMVSIDADNKTSLTNPGTIDSISETYYNAKGQVDHVVAAYAPGTAESNRAITTYIYDDLGRQQYVIGPMVTVQGAAVRLVSETVYDDAFQGRRSQEITNLAIPADTLISSTGDFTSAVNAARAQAHTTTFGYDDRGNVTSTTYTVAGTTESITTHAQYDALGHLISETDALNQTKAYTYDPISGQLATVTLPSVYDPVSDSNAHPVYQYQYDANGNLLVITDPLGHETHFIYNDQGQQLTRTLPLGYGPDGKFETSDDTDVPTGDFTEESKYDELGRQTYARDFEGRITQFVYDDTPYTGHPKATGQLIQKRFFDNSTQYAAGTGIPVESVSYQYDEYGRTTVVTTVRRDPLTNTAQAPEDVTTTYDTQGRVSSITSPQGVINYEYSAVNGQMTRTWTGTDMQTPVNDFRYTYDNLGRLQTVTVIRRNSQTLTTPEITQYGYDLLGNLIRLDDSNGDVTQYVYDGFNRLTQLTNYAPDTTPDDLSDNPKLSEFQYHVRADGSRDSVDEDFWTYDSEMHETSDLHHHITWSYDALNRLTQEVFDSSINSEDFAAIYSFDLTGNRLTKVTDNGIDEVDDQRITYGYDANDRLETETQDNTLTGAGTYEVVAYDYDHTTQTEKTTSVGGVITSQVNYAYNVQGQLASAVIREYGSVGDAPDAQWAEVKRTIASYTYDDSGIRITATERVLTDADADPETEPTESSFTSTEYLNDPHNLTGYSQVLQETQSNAANQIIKTIITTVGLDVLTQATYGQSLPSDGQVLTLLYDGHGSTRMLANVAGILAIVASTPQQFHYDAYGNAVGFNPANAVTTLLYSGEQWDQRIQMQYLRARYYDGTTGRFVGLDPFAGRSRDPQSFHKYLYTHGNPTNGIDPTGRMDIMSTLVGTAITSAIGALLVGAFQTVANYAMDRPLTEGIGYALIFGAVGAPLSVLCPLVGVGIAILGFGSASYVNYYAWCKDPNPTWSKRGAAMLLLVAATYGGNQAWKNFQTHGWSNPNGLQQAGRSVLLNKNSTLAEWLAGTPDDAYIHISPESPATLRVGVHASSGRAGWVRFGDVKHLTPEQYRINVVGPLAGGHSPKAVTYAIRMPNPENSTIFTEVAPDMVNAVGCPEFETAVDVVPDAFIIVPKGPPR